MRMPKRLVTGFAALGLVGGTAVVVAAPADAAVTPAAASCVFANRTTGTNGTNAHGLPEYSGDSYAKPATSQTTCHDLNITGGTIGASYEGWLYYGNGNWGACTAGYVKFTGAPIVLCTNVAATTIMGVTSSAGYGNAIVVED